MKDEIEAALSLLRQQFPDVPVDAVTSLFGDSYHLVVSVTGQPLVDKAEELTRLRLEVRTRHPALPVAAASAPSSAPGPTALS